MFGFKKKVQKVNLYEITNTLDRRHYQFTVMPGSDVVVIEGKYNNNDREFQKLYLHFVGEDVSFKDGRGNFINKVPKTVKIKDMYPHILNILNVIN